MRTRVARFSAVAAVALSALILAACGTESVDVPEGDTSAAAGAEIFAANCAGCHTMTPAGTNGSGNRALRAQGPNFDQRYLGYDEVLFAIRNGGYSGAIMPQNIITGEDASLVAEFVSKYSGTEAQDSPRPSPTPGTEGSAEDTAAADGLGGGAGAENSPPDASAPHGSAQGGQGSGGPGASSGGGSNGASGGGSGSGSGSASGSGNP